MLRIYLRNLANARCQCCKSMVDKNNNFQDFIINFELWCSKRKVLVLHVTVTIFYGVLVPYLTLSDQYTLWKAYFIKNRCDMYEKRAIPVILVPVADSRGEGGALGASAPPPPPPSKKSSTYINIRFSRLVNVTIWLLIEWFRSVWWK